MISIEISDNFNTILQIVSAIGIIVCLINIIIFLLRRNKNNAISEEYRDGGFSNRHEIKPWFNKKTKEPVDPFDPDTHRSVIEYWFEEE